MNNTIGENIKKVRKQKHMTQRELAEAIGMRDAAISQYEKGIVTPPLETLKQLADVLGINPADLIDYTPMEKALEQWAENYDANNLPDEVKLPLLRSFAQLNDDGRNKVIEYVEDITPKYKK